MDSRTSEAAKSDGELRRSGLSWNVVATAQDLEQRHLGRRLRRFGDFWWTPFRGVMVGRVEDHEAFFKQLRHCEEDEPGFLDPLSKLVPVDHTFTFSVKTFGGLLKAMVLPYANQIDSGSFYVRMERRGHRGEIHSQQAEQDLDRLLIETLQTKGASPRIDFKNPDVIVAVELIGDECGWESSRGHCESASRF